MILKPFSIHNFIQSYIDSRTRIFGPDDWKYASFTPPNTTCVVSDDFFDLLPTLSPSSIKVLCRVINLVKRSKSTILACSCLAPYSSFDDIISKRGFSSAIQELETCGLIHKTPNRSLIILEVSLINKTFKLDIDDTI